MAVADDAWLALFRLEAFLVCIALLCHYVVRDRPKDAICRPVVAVIDVPSFPLLQFPITLQEPDTSRASVRVFCVGPISIAFVVWLVVRIFVRGGFQDEVLCRFVDLLNFNGLFNRVDAVIAGRLLRVLRAFAMNAR